MGLREKNRANRTNLIVESAMDLFIKKGFKETSISDIAAAADVSPRLIYYYFQSKDNVLLEVLNLHSARWLAYSNVLLNRISQVPEIALATLLCAEIELAMQRLPSRNIWRNILAISIKNESAEKGNRVYNMAHLQSEPLKKLLLMLVEKNQVQRNTDIDECTWFFWSLSRSAFRDYVSNETISYDDLIATVRCHVRLACNGILTKEARQNAQQSVHA